MEKPLTKLKKYLQKGYRITDLFYYWSENEAPHVHIILEKNKGKLEDFKVEGDEALEFITNVNKILKKI